MLTTKKAPGGQPHTTARTSSRSCGAGRAGGQLGGTLGLRTAERTSGRVLANTRGGPWILSLVIMGSTGIILINFAIVKCIYTIFITKLMYGTRAHVTDGCAESISAAAKVRDILARNKGLFAFFMVLVSSQGTDIQK